MSRRSSVELLLRTTGRWRALLAEIHVRWVRRQIEHRAGPRTDSGANDAPGEDVSNHGDAATGGNLVGHGHSRRLIPSPALRSPRTPTCAAS